MSTRTLSAYIAWCDLHDTKATVVGLKIFERLQEVSRLAK